MKKYTTVAVAALLVLIPGIVLAHGRHHHRGPSVPPIVSPAPKPPVGSNPTPPSVPTSPETTVNVYTTFYASGDNTPRGSTITFLDGKEGNAGGTGTYTNPITLAVGHSISNGKDTADYAYGTLFYFPDLKKYFVAQDTCGDGTAPQNGACHKDIDHPGIVQLDLYAGNGSFENCEDNLTGIRSVVMNPANNLAVDITPLCK